MLLFSTQGGITDSSNCSSITCGKTLVNWSSGYGRETRVPKVVGQNPSAVYWMDIFKFIFVVKLKCLFEKTKINKKEAGDAPFTQKKHL